MIKGPQGALADRLRMLAEGDLIVKHGPHNHRVDKKANQLL